MVPEAEFTSYYGRNIVHAPPWDAGIPAYIFLGGLAAGSALVGAGAHLAGHATLRRNSRVAAIVAVGLGSGALIADLGRPERFLNMMRTVKLTSPMSVGSWILAGFGAASGAALAVEVAQSLVRRGGARRVAPSIRGLGAVRIALSVADPLASAGSAFFAPPLAAYTAVLLTDTASPMWHESYRELPFVFVSSAIASGAGLALVTAPTRETRPVRRLAALGSAGELAADALLTRRLGDLGRPLHEGKARRWHAVARGLTTAGALGAVVFGGRRAGAVMSGLALMAGSMCTRFAVFEAGMASSEDPEYTVRPQREASPARRAQGRSITQPGGAWPR